MTPSRPCDIGRRSLRFRYVRPIQLSTEDYATNPGHDTGISHAVVKEVGAARQPETLRLHHTGDVVAFGKHDTITPGYAEAVAASLRCGFTPIERLAGGRAAVFHTGTLAFAWATPTNDPRAGVTARFKEIAELLSTALRSLGVDAQVGEIPGEYCPGAYSIHAEHRSKLVGVGQRLVRGAAHVGGVISPKLHWLPSTAGAIDDFVPDITVDTVRDAVIAAFSERFELTPVTLPTAIVQMGLELAPGHISPA